jgi:hypothetical protein
MGQWGRGVGIRMIPWGGGNVMTIANLAGRMLDSRSRPAGFYKLAFCQILDIRENIFQNFQNFQNSRIFKKIKKIKTNQKKSEIFKKILAASLRFPSLSENDVADSIQNLRRASHTQFLTRRAN